MGILFTILMGFLFTITLGILFTIVLGIQFTISKGTVYQIFPSPEEFVGLADTFRNEGPINFNTSGKYFVTAAEEIGEEETRP